MTRVAALALSCSALLATPAKGAEALAPDVATIVGETIRPMMTRYGVPGMAVGIVTDQGSAVYDFGVASKATGAPVADDTLFELGSLSKTFTATLVAVAQGEGRLALSDTVGQDFPALRGTSMDEVSLLNLGTHTTGGMPLQFPDAVTTDVQALTFFRTWTPPHRPGTVRTYANPSIGLLGLIAASRLGGDFATLMQRRVFEPLHLDHTFLDVPPAEMAQYAQGYTKTDAPIRMAPGALGPEAYGVRSTAADVLRFVAANLGLVPVDAALKSAIDATHTGYFKVGPMVQDLIWEQYRTPVTLPDLVEGNSARISYEANPVTALDPPLNPRDDVLLNKTGSTNGFGGYVVFVPGKRIGIVLLANKNYPIEARVTAAYTMLSRLTGEPGAR